MNHNEKELKSKTIPRPTIIIPDLTFYSNYYISTDTPFYERETLTYSSSSSSSPEFNLPIKKRKVK